ncbi:MAG: glycosyltransferase [Thermaerobacter sp.]|nr:glycosyltransferase [Thermaerobacter sp.]
MTTVLHVLQSGDRGGVQRHVRDLALGLREETAGVVAGTGGWLAQSVRDAGIPIRQAQQLRRSMDPRRIASARREVERAYRDLLPQVVHAHGIFALLAAMPLHESVPLVYTAHGFQWHDATHPAWIRSLSWVMHRQAVTKVSAFVAIAGEADEARALGFSRVEEIPNGVTLPLEGTPIGGPNTFGVATRLVAGKGLEDLAKVLQVLGAATLVVAGEGPQGAALMQAAARLGVGSRVRLLGWQDDLVPFYRSISAYVSLSRKEGLPYAALDALAAGLPVVLSDIPGHRELVPEGRNGFLTRLGDASAAATALGRLFADEDLRQSAGAASREVAKEHFALSDMLRRHQALYTELGGGSR